MPLLHKALDSFGTHKALGSFDGVLVKQSVIFSLGGWCIVDGIHLASFTVFVMRTEAAFGFLDNHKRNRGWASDINYSNLGLWIRHVVFEFRERV